MSRGFRLWQSAPVKCLWPAAATLGESPCWNPELQCLDFIDVMAGQVLRYWPRSRQRERIQVAAGLGFLVRDAGGATWCGAGLDVLDLTRTGSVRSRRFTLPGDPGRLRLNDGCIDSLGTLWTGTMDRAGREPLGGLFRVSSDGTVEQFDDGYTIPNGFALDPLARRIYVADSPRGRVSVYELGADGRPGPRRAWLDVARRDGFPDGMTVDAEGHLWAAMYGGGCVRRYRPDATLERELRVPTRNVTSCSFGGVDGKILYVTTAVDHEGQKWPFWPMGRTAGALFAHRVASPHSSQIRVR